MQKKPSKQGLPLILFLAAALFLMPLTAAQGTSPTTTVSIINGPVEVYATAHLGSPVIATLATGTRVQVVSFDANWAQISLGGGTTGYVVTSYLNFGAPVPTTAPWPTVGPPVITTTAIVQNGPLNVHSAAALQSTVIAQLPTGSRVQIISYNANWSEILLASNARGYVVTSYLRFGTANPTPGPTAVHHERAETAGANATIQSANRGPVHLRVNPSFDAAILDTYANGSRVQALSLQGTWYYLRVGGRVGYMDAEFVRLDSGVTIGNTGEGYDAVVQNPTSGEILHLRQRPDTSSPSLAQYRNGTYVEVLAAGVEWHHVRVEGQEGYMKSEFVHITSPGATMDKTVIATQGDTVSLREGPGDNTQVADTLASGATVTVLIPGETWSRVQYWDDGTQHIGYLRNDNLQSPVVTEFDG